MILDILPGRIIRPLRKLGNFLSSIGSDHMTRELHRAWKNKSYFLYCELVDELGYTVGYTDPEYLDYQALCGPKYKEYWNTPC